MLRGYKIRMQLRQQTSGYCRNISCLKKEPVLLANRETCIFLLLLVHESQAPTAKFSCDLPRLYLYAYFYL